MTKQEIITKAIEKANVNGWGRDDIKVESDLSENSFGLVFAYAFIYSHDFAKALWPQQHTLVMDDDDYGNTVVSQLCPNCGNGLNVADCWQAFLQQMVIADDPIKYLGEHI